jgi:hypothetical protein
MSVPHTQHQSNSEKSSSSSSSTPSPPRVLKQDEIAVGIPLAHADVRTQRNEIETEFQNFRKITNVLSNQIHQLNRHLGTLPFEHTPVALEQGGGGASAGGLHSELRSLNSDPFRDYMASGQSRARTLNSKSMNLRDRLEHLRDRLEHLSGSQAPGHSLPSITYHDANSMNHRNRLEHLSGSGALENPLPRIDYGEYVLRKPYGMGPASSNDSQALSHDMPVLWQAPRCGRASVGGLHFQISENLNSDPLRDCMASGQSQVRTVNSMNHRIPENLNSHSDFQVSNLSSASSWTLTRRADASHRLRLRDDV